jgi:hypothetical protein
MRSSAVKASASGDGRGRWAAEKEGGGRRRRRGVTEAIAVPVEGGATRRGR